MMSCAGAGESQPIPLCAWRDTLGPPPNSGSASNSNTTFAPPDKPGYERSRKRPNRDPQPLRRRGSRLRASTGRVAGVNSFDYLVELMRNVAQVAASPREWMPWGYRAALD